MATNRQLSSFPVFLRGPAWFVLLLLLSGARPARGHAVDETYLTLTLSESRLSGRWEVAQRDLQQALGLGSGGRPLPSASELASLIEGLAVDTMGRLEIKADGQVLPVRVTDHLAITLNNAAYIRIVFEMPPLARSPATLRLDARGLFRIDASMHGLLKLERRDGLVDTAVFSAQEPVHEFVLGGDAGRWRRWRTFVGEGVWHIWLGFDHILFLLALLLPAVLRREGARWAGLAEFRPALMNVLGIVTAFTLAHSLTLSLAALGVVRLPSRLVESVIAASVALAALNNLWPWVRGRSWLVAFGFGLVHGFGFASVLSELGVAGGTLALALVGFNAGVELGQMALVVIFLPFAFAVRHSPWYQTGLLKGGSAAVVILALVWLVQRAFGSGAGS